MIDPRLKRHPLGFLELVDKPDPAALADYYAEKYYQAEASNYRSAYPAEELEVISLRIALRAERARALSRGDKPGRLLDVGCGEGFVLAAFAKDGWEVEGIDHSRAGVDAMNPTVSDRVTQGNVFDVLKQRISDGEHYDLVWLANVLEHVLDPIELLTSLRRLVAPGGLMIVTVPNDGTGYHRDLHESGAIPEHFWIAIPDHVSYFTAPTLIRAAEATGWSVRDVQGDFPVDLFLAHEGSNYVRDRDNGPGAHTARLRFERLIAANGTEAANRFYSALADIGLGRNITAYLAPSDTEPQVG